MSSPVVTNFMKQQGFAEEPADACQMRFGALYFQPRIVFPMVLLATVLQSAVLFLLLAAVLAWNVAVPRLNPFERAYNRWIAGRRGGLVLTPAPAPRRFAQAVAAVLMLGTARGSPGRTAPAGLGAAKACSWSRFRPCSSAGSASAPTSSISSEGKPPSRTRRCPGRAARAVRESPGQSGSSARCGSGRAKLAAKPTT